MMKKAFTLVEMLIVVAIIGILVAVSLVAFGPAIGNTEKANCQELAFDTAAALTALFQDKGRWPTALIANNAKESAGLDETAAYPLAKGGYMTLTYDSNTRKLTGYDKFGVVTPWAVKVLRSRGTSAQLSDRVPGGGTIQDHVFHYALDLDGDGIIEDVNVGGEVINVRATAIVWCGGKDGKIEAYSDGLRGDDVYSWHKGQTENVK